ncbi:MAG: cysteine desulfurase family protein [Cellulosilyticaceae bacterium]
MKEILYLDHCAATPVLDKACLKFNKVANEIYANPSSTHLLGNCAQEYLNESRNNTANLLNVKPQEIIFTSGATESNNLAISGIVNAARRKNNNIHIITSQIEHPSVYKCYKALEGKGIDVSYIPVDREGIIDMELLSTLIKPTTVLVSIMHVNNETGVVQPIDEIARIIKKKSNAYLHVDGVQAIGKVAVNLSDIDLYTISGHKIGAYRGIGLLVVKEHVELEPLLYGGNQEYNYRPGTENVAGIVAFSEALKHCIDCFEEETKKLTKIQKQLFKRIGNIPGITINTPAISKAAPHIFNFSIVGYPSSIILERLSSKRIMVSSQSACSSKKNTQSRVLMAITKDDNIASSSIRMSYNSTLKLTELEYFINCIEEISYRFIQFSLIN